MNVCFPVATSRVGISWKARTVSYPVACTLRHTWRDGTSASHSIPDLTCCITVETDDGLLLTPFDPAFADWALAYEKTNKRYRNTLRALVK